MTHRIAMPLVAAVVAGRLHLGDARLPPASPAEWMPPSVPETFSPAAAWGFGGHRTVCEIAWREVDENVRRRIRALTRAFGEYRTFAESCVWADTPEGKALHNAHWIDSNPGAELVTLEDCPEDCILRHLEAELEILNDAARSDAARARALMFVGHFVADLHQPLHVAYRIDRGGNEHGIVGLDDRYDDLHAVWDSYLIESPARDWRAYAARLQGDVNPVDRSLWIGGDPLTWANESYRIVEDYVYEGLEGPDGSRLGAAYVVVNRRAVERQLKKAGVRLAAILSGYLTVP